jgi:hypothetical protein
MVAGYTRFMAPLKELGFLTPVERNQIPSHLKPLEYLSVHPVLPLMLRNSAPYSMNFLGITNAVKQSCAYYYAYRIQR